MEAYPLHWPLGRPRTSYPVRSRFDTSQDVAQRGLMFELERLGASRVILSTNIELRRDGLPRAGRRPPDDVGVAVYFTWKGEQYVFSCDQWDRLGDNIQAIRKTIEAIRGIERWGTGEAMRMAFTGFKALPPAGGSGANVVEQAATIILGAGPGASFDEVKAAYRRRVHETHPDKGGDRAEFDRVQRAWNAYQATHQPEPA